MSACCPGWPSAGPGSSRCLLLIISLAALGGMATGFSLRIMERLDQGLLHPPLGYCKTNMSCLGIEPGSPVLQVCTLAKSYSNSLCCCYLELLHGWPSACGCYMWANSVIRLKGNKPITAFTQIALASDAPWISGTCKAACLNHARVTTMERHDQGHLHSLLEHHETNTFRPGIEPWLPVLQAITLTKTFLNSLCCCNLELLQYYILMWEDGVLTLLKLFTDQWKEHLKVGGWVGGGGGEFLEAHCTCYKFFT